MLREVFLTFYETGEVPFKDGDFLIVTLRSVHGKEQTLTGQVNGGLFIECCGHQGYSLSQIRTFAHLPDSLRPKVDSKTN